MNTADEIWSRVLDRTRRTGENLLELRHYRAFKAFYERLPRQDDLYYVFFTTGLLHWLIKMQSFVPSATNLVLLGAGLNHAERDWVHRNIARPFHHIDMPVDDVTVWKFLFAANRRSFGWVDVDCLVLNSELFAEMSAIDAGTSMNCTWSFASAHGRPMLCTHFVFVNAAVRDRVLRDTGIGPETYAYRGCKRGRDFSAYAHTRMLSRRHVGLLRRVLPDGRDALPEAPQKAPSVHLPCFDTLLTYQLVAEALGYMLGHVRRLDGRNSTEPSSELIHVAGISYYERSADRSDPDARAFYRHRLQLDRALLSHLGSRLPSAYRQRLLSVEDRCRREGLCAREFSETVRQGLERIGVSGAASEALFPELLRPSDESARPRSVPGHVAK